MEHFFRTYGWIINLLLWAIASLFVAMSINSFIASQLAPYTVPEQPLVHAAKKKNKGYASNVAKKSRDRVNDLAKRCLFGCEKEDPKTPQCPEEGCPNGQECSEGQCIDLSVLSGPFDASTPVRSDLNLTLMGAMVSNKPQWSTALMQDPSTQQTYILRVGELFMGEAELIEVHRDRIIFKRNRRLEYIRLNGAITGNPGQSTHQPKTRKPPPPSSPSLKLKKRASTHLNPLVPLSNGINGIKAVSKSAFVLDRKLVDSKLRNKAQLSRGATVVPNFTNGKKSGLKLLGVKDNSLYSSLGIKSGDVLQSINGTTIKSQAHALELMERFKKSKKLSVSLDRLGRRQTLTYTIK